MSTSVGLTGNQWLQVAAILVPVAVMLVISYVRTGTRLTTQEIKLEAIEKKITTIKDDTLQAAELDRLKACQATQAACPARRDYITDVRRGADEECPVRVVLRPGHGLCPPSTPTRDYSYAERGLRHWHLQRPGNREDDHVGEFCGEYLIPALGKAGHCVATQRAIDPVTGDLDTTPTTVGPETLPGLLDEQAATHPRWRYSAAVEGALRGSSACRSWAGYSWSFDPVASCQWESATPGDGVYLSIHQNWWSSPKMFGPAVLYYGKGPRHFSRAGRSLASGVYNSIADAFEGDDWSNEAGIPWSPARSAYRIRTGSRWSCQWSALWELRATRRPAVLVELAFASNAGDADRMASPDWCERMADAIARGLAA